MKRKILAFFKKNQGLNLKAKEIAKHLKIKELRQYDQLKFHLHQLVKDGTIIKMGKRYQLNRPIDFPIRGKLQISSDGSYGFVIPNEKSLNDIFIPEKYLSTAFSGDIVEVALLAKKRGKNLEGEIVNVLERKREEIIGALKKSKAFFFVVADDKDIHRDIYIAKRDLNKAKNGDKVVVTDIDWGSPKQNPEGIIKEVLGKAGSFDAELASMAREFNLSYKFPVEVEKEVAAITEEIPAEEIKRRLDLREENIFTIDPYDAKDFDDAVSIKKLENGNREIGIHIADVSHYVNEGTALYDEAIKRATSVYFVGKVVPMLPEKLSNQICSLVPYKDRLTFSVIVEITPRGKVIDYKIDKTVINSKRRFTYEEVQDILDNGKGEFYDEVFQLNKISKIFRQKRMTAGSINFSTPEVKFKLDEDGKPIDAIVKVIQESNNLIEELMLLANKLIAAHLNKDTTPGSRIPFVYRIHDLPDTEKLKEFSTFVKTLGFNFDVNSKNQSKQFQYLLQQVEGTNEESVVNEVAIRSMAKAIYSTENIGHYGLGFKFYTHFTSPIRRFPDLIVHKVIFENIKSNKSSYSAKQLEFICEHCSQSERNAVEAERYSVKMKQVEFLKTKLGEDFDGVISGVTHFGLFIKLNSNLAEGLLHIRDLDDDYYDLDEKNYQIAGKQSGKKFRLGDKIQIKLARVDEEKKEIDFVLLNS